MTPFEFFRTPIQIRRQTAGVYVNGKRVEGPYTIINATASIQPLKGQEVELLPEGRRDSESYKMYTSTQIYGIEPQPTLQNPDQITVLKGPFTGLVFEVIQINTWQNNPNFNIVNHYKYIAFRLHPLT